MEKVYLLEMLAKNLELMNAIERVVKVADHDPFIESLQAEWHTLCKENGSIINDYKRYGAIEEIPQCTCVAEDN